MSSAIEGRNAVLEALRSGMPMLRVLVAEGSSGTPISDIEHAAAKRGVPVTRVPKRKLESHSERGAHQGVIAFAEEFPFTDISKVIGDAEGKKDSLVVVLDHINDSGNLGAIVRSVEVAGGDAVVIPKRRTASVGAGAYKTSAGALAHLPIVQESNLVRVIERLKDAGYWVAGADASGAQLAWAAPLEGRLVLVMGSEGEGLSRLVREKCDFLVRLPVAGHVDSLNVAQATTVLAFEWVRRRSAT